jgi:hypothetical protein
MLPEHVDPLACEFCIDAEKINGRPNRRKPLNEFKSKLHVGYVPFPATLLDKPARLPWLKKNQTLSLNPLNRYSSSSFCSHLVRLSPESQQEEPLVLSRYDAAGAIHASLPQPSADGCLSGF